MRKSRNCSLTVEIGSLQRSRSSHRTPGSSPSYAGGPPCASKNQPSWKSLNPSSSQPSRHSLLASWPMTYWCPVSCTQRPIDALPSTLIIENPSTGLIVHEPGHQYVMGQLANNEWREGWLDEGFSDFQEGWFFEAHGGPPAYDGLEHGVLWLDLERWSEPISTVSEQFRDFLIYQEMIYSKAQLFYEQLRYVVGDETMRRILREYFARWKLKHVDEDAFRRVGEEVSRQDLKWLFGEWLHATPLIDYRLRRVERHRLP